MDKEWLKESLRFKQGSHSFFTGWIDSSHRVDRCQCQTAKDDLEYNIAGPIVEEERAALRQAG